MGVLVMVGLIEKEVKKHGDRAKVFPARNLKRLEQDSRNTMDSGLLDKFQKNIVNGFQDINLPNLDFTIRSIIIVASPSPSTVTVNFNWQGEKVPLKLPSTYMDMTTAPLRIESYLNDFLKSMNYQIKYAPRLPRNLLAVRSGLGTYGRNNLCYVEGLGSFINLVPFYSNIPCEDDIWHEMLQMDICKSCKACLDNCPTGAIVEERFLIKTERCLTYYNEVDSKWDFPEWVDKSSHNSIYGCSRCQDVCNVNKRYIDDNKIKPIEFTEEETSLLLEGKPIEELSRRMKRKIKVLNMSNYLAALPRNLNILLK